MSLTLLVWLFIACSIAISALIAFPLRLDTARRALLTRLQSSSRTLIVAAAAFLLVAGIGAVTSYVGSASKAAGAGSLPHYGSNDETLARLKDYTRSIGTAAPPSTGADGKLLPDVSTMVERLEARLKTAPGDVKGWRMLGWSYFHTGRYKEAVTALAKAVELDPNSAELKAVYEEAKTKASQTASLSQTGGVGRGGDEPGVEKKDKSGAGHPHEHDAIRAMVDGLAARLESSPRDVEGWARLIRSRVVLGENEVAARALRKALEIFKDDAAASGRITAAANGLGLKAD
jgi:cytochrome c-type biogenesis protein CcmH